MRFFNRKNSLNKALNEIDAKKLNFILENGKPNNLGCENLIHFSYKVVKIEIPDLISKGLFFECAEILKVKVKKANDLLAFIMWILNEIQHIQKIEKAKLECMPEMELIQAGINNLDVFGEINIIDNLAGGDVLKWDLILELPYYRVLDKLSKSNVERQIQKNYQKIMELKAKRK